MSRFSYQSVIAVFFLLLNLPGGNASDSVHSRTVSSDGEWVPAGEAAAIREITQMLHATVQAGYEANGRAFRDAHHKHHGCVKASFTVLDGLDPLRAQGLFAQPKTYAAWIRFSNGSGRSQDDQVGDGRGMALKVLGVDGRKILEDESEERTQDFLMINHPVFFVRNATEYVAFQKAALGGEVWKWLFHPKRIFHELRIAKSIQGKTVLNPLESRYWSMTASRLGSEQMKFSARPCVGQNFTNPSSGTERLRENLDAHLVSESACFDFLVQLRADPRSMPVEDPTVEWPEDRAPFVTVARLTIPPQRAEQGEFCEGLSFTPWHSIEAHRPLGGISRVRKEVYREISKLRHELNGQVREEPQE